jgi:hypothetical protein
MLQKARSRDVQECKNCGTPHVCNSEMLVINRKFELEVVSVDSFAGRTDFKESFVERTFTTFPKKLHFP